MFKKLICMTLIICVLMLMNANAFASTDSTAHENVIVRNFDFGEVVAKEFPNAKNVTNADGSILYSYDVTDEVKATAKVWEDTEKNTYVRITEGDIQNLILVTNDGELWLDGKKVKITITKAENDFVTSDTLNVEDKSFTDSNQIMNVGRHYNKTEYVVACPYGSPSDYTVFVDNFTVDIEFLNAVKNLAVSAIATIISTAMFEIADIGTSTSTAISIAASVFTAVSDSMKQNTPEAVATSVTVVRNKHTMGYQVPHSDLGEARFVYKDNLSYYVDIGSPKLHYLTTENKYLLTRILS